MSDLSYMEKLLDGVVTPAVKSVQSNLGDFNYAA